MLWMGTWIYHNAGSNTCVHTDVGSQPKYFITAGWQSMTLWNGWGSYPSSNGSPIPSQHMKGIWQLSYAVDGHIEPSTCDYHYMCSSRCGKSNEILHHSWATKDTIVQWLRLSSNPTWKGSQIPFQHMKGVGVSICCGWVHGSIIMPLPPHWEVSWNLYHCWALATQDSIVWWLRL